MKWTFFKYKFLHHLHSHGGDHARIQILILTYDILKLYVCQVLKIALNVSYYFFISF
jgi:hypothetical protein